MPYNFNSVIVKKIPIVLWVFLLFSTLIFLFGCDFTKCDNYRKAKEIMEFGTMDAHMRTRALIRDSTINITERSRPTDYTCLELAAELFDSLNDYKNSKKLAKKARYEAATYFYRKYQAEKNVIWRKRLYWERAYSLFSGAGDYADANDKTLEYSALRLKENLEFNEIEKSKHARDIAKLFDLFDEKSKAAHAHLIYEYVTPNLISEVWGWDEESTLEGSMKIKEKRESFLYDLSLLNAIKEYKYASDDIREKMYKVAIDRVDTDEFWKKEIRYSSSELKYRKHLQVEIFDYLENYKDSRNWLKRIKDFDFNDFFITQTEYEEKANEVGSDPQLRTILIVLSGEKMNLDNSFDITSDIRLLGRWLKSEMKGNIFFTRNPSEASIVIEKKISHTFYQSFRYKGKNCKNSMVDYYHTNVVMKIQTTDGQQLWEKSMRSTNLKPYQEVGENVKKVFFQAPYAHPDILGVLNNYFTEQEKSSNKYP